MLEARLILATIYRDSHLELVPGTDLDLIATITARPKGEIPMTVYERQATRERDEGRFRDQSSQYSTESSIR